eukprot:15439508-Alexandrium_andersonii.AAC.1
MLLRALVVARSFAARVGGASGAFLGWRAFAPAAADMPILALATSSSRQKPYGSALARAAASPAALFSKQQTDD